ncbi:hypothetical protein [Sulfuricurvum sp.]|uniref:hypothetical protein n=1 Tax=Sulfuricurvum sp. TaxID=2025608 RepID=UPI0026302987|nr:hypothetical protein [Sulfuricurvum sp.]MDD2267889.1 hypothetical protein [Sulfuricurvum sp.]
MQTQTYTIDAKKAHEFLRTLHEKEEAARRSIFGKDEAEEWAKIRRMFLGTMKGKK